MNSEKVLIDTSIWICVFKPGGSQKIREEVDSLLAEQRVATSEIIVLELVRGVPSKDEFLEMLADFDVFPNLPIDRGVWETAFGLSFSLKKKGVMIPVADIIIASVAIRHKVMLFHADKHFHFISRKAPLREKYLTIVS